MKNLDELRKAIAKESIRLSSAMGKEMNEYKERVLALYSSEEELDKHIDLTFAGYIMAVSNIFSYVAELQASMDDKCDRETYVLSLNKLLDDIKGGLVKACYDYEK